MKRFNDSTGKQWEIDIDLETIENVNSACQVDLTKLFDNKLELLSRLYADPALLVAVLWCLCGKDESEKNAFRKLWRGDSLEAAANALTQDVIDFFPSPQQRITLRNLLQKMQETANKVQEQAQSDLDKIDPTALVSAISSQASSVSTPADSPSAS